MDDLMPSMIRGVNFGPYAIYNTVYKGPLVTDVLKKAGVDLSKCKNMHMVTTGADEDFPGDPVKTSVPFTRILDPKNEVILAITANGDPLPEDHGYPVRILYPGFIGLRSTKWLQKMEIREKEHPGRFNAKQYKTVHAKKWEDVDFT